MTEEEKEAIERLNRIITTKFNNDYSIDSLDKEAIETVLNMLKENSAEIEQKNTELAEKSAEIEKYKYLYQKSLEDLVKAEKKNMQKDKQRDLMLKYINYLSDELVQATGRNELEFCNGNRCCKDSDYSCEQCIEQYFERKVKK